MQDSLPYTRFFQRTPAPNARLEPAYRLARKRNEKPIGCNRVETTGSLKWLSTSQRKALKMAVLPLSDGPMIAFTPSWKSRRVSL